MFQHITRDITYERYKKSYVYRYVIKDTSFTSAFDVNINNWDADYCIDFTIQLIKKYESINYKHKEIIKNLFLLNMFLVNNKWYKNINDQLEIIDKHLVLIERYYPEINFKKYYNDLVKYSKKMIVLFER